MGIEVRTWVLIRTKVISLVTLWYKEGGLDQSSSAGLEGGEEAATLHSPY
jgi:hypothetical protein